MLVNVDPGLIIWTIVTFLILVFILGKFGWKPIISALESREQGINDALARAEKARQDAQKIIEEHQMVVEKGEAEARDIVQASREVSERIRREADVTAREESNRILNQARRDIQNAKEAALREIRDVVADLAVKAAGNIVRAELDPERHREMIDDLIDTMPGSDPK
jgi:F-type H+-transporting ATPase subunit b